MRDDGGGQVGEHVYVGAVGEHHALGEAGGAAGVYDGGHILFLGGHSRIFRLLPDEQRLVLQGGRVLPLPPPHHVRRLGSLSRGPLHGLGQGTVVDHDPRPAVSQLVPHLRSGEAIIERHRYGACHLYSIVELHEGGVVVKHDEHPVPGLHAQADEGAGQPQRPAAQLTPADPLLPVGDHLTMRIAAHAGQQIAGGDVR